MNPHTNPLGKRIRLRPVGTNMPTNVIGAQSSKRTTKPHSVKKLLRLGILLALVASQVATLYLLKKQSEQTVQASARSASLDRQLAELRNRHYQTLLQVGHRERIDPKGAKSAFEVAADYATSTNLDGQEANEALRSLPTCKQLSSDCRIEILQAKRSSPISFVDVTVVRDGKFVEGLGRQDFELSTGNQRLKYLSVGESDSTLSQLHVAVLLDCSSSTAGSPFVEEQKGAIQFCRTIAPTSYVRLWRFADDAQPITDWTNDGQTLSNAIQRLQSSGGTALHSALRAAIAALSSRIGERAIVLFTDGRSSDGNQQPEALLQLCRQFGVKVHCVALKTKDVDERFLQKLSRDSNGSYSSVTDPSKLAHSFMAIAASLKRKMYRIVVLDSFDSSAPVTVQVGNLPPRSVSFKSEKPRDSDLGIMRMQGRLVAGSIFGEEANEERRKTASRAKSDGTCFYQKNR